MPASLTAKRNARSRTTATWSSTRCSTRTASSLPRRSMSTTFPALMKSFIDRIGYESHRPRFFGKQAMVMAVCGGFGADKAAGYMSDILTTFGYNVASSLELQASTKSAKETALNQEKAAAAFETLVAAIQSGARKPPALQQVIMFHLFKAISNAYPDKFQRRSPLLPGQNRLL